ncbi:hypothetical protein M427DRAFT_31975 [Gonapodya prolifera JEL478]|uniref:Uncharacterized protein n=1 Tax=Gonapodya prolifera (strain JEL478) TaxID=1344416 RepID=A0A139AGY6_GONPJ|nr:hypothetical protein M427DRAFT_31975 [Gonapodya prolifera JEL478]|eukprot:KXS16066.1 hypothetical protein M427DRAFT_31975 [Gonapodya prolifera JEL478]
MNRGKTSDTGSRAGMKAGGSKSKSTAGQVQGNTLDQWAIRPPPTSTSILGTPVVQSTTTATATAMASGTALTTATMSWADEVEEGELQERRQAAVQPARQHPQQLDGEVTRLLTLLEAANRLQAEMQAELRELRRQVERLTAELVSERLASKRAASGVNGKGVGGRHIPGAGGVGKNNRRETDFVRPSRIAAMFQDRPAARTFERVFVRPRNPMPLIDASLSERRKRIGGLVWEMGIRKEVVAAVMIPGGTVEMIVETEGVEAVLETAHKFRHEVDDKADPFAPPKFTRQTLEQARTITARRTADLCRMLRSREFQETTLAGATEEMRQAVLAEYRKFVRNPYAKLGHRDRAYDKGKGPGNDAPMDLGDEDMRTSSTGAAHA